MHKIFYSFVLVVMLINNPVQGQQLQVSTNARFLVKNDSLPFFWLGDTAWELFHRLNETETEQYLKNRAVNGFNVIQCVILAELDGLNVGNCNGDVPFNNLNPDEPNEAYFKHVDRVIEKAWELGLYLAILPSWGSFVIDKEKGPYNSYRFFNEETVYNYGLFLGSRYKNCENIVWILGGDRSPEGYIAIWYNMAKGIKDGGANQLMSYHNSGERSSSELLHHANWLNFNMVQSGHISMFYRNYELISKDYNLKPVKPVLDGEPIYEGIPIAFGYSNNRADDYLVRVAAYWSVFAGSFGHTYGHNSIWQMYDDEKRQPVVWANISWKEALDAKGSCQMKYLKNLMLSRPYFSRIPDQSVITPEATNGTDHLQATRDGSLNEKDATYIMVYYPYLSHKFKIKTDVIQSAELNLWWYNPRNGESFFMDKIENTGLFQLPWGSNIKTDGSGPDWILIVDDASKDYPDPGKRIN